MHFGALAAERRTSESESVRVSASGKATLASPMRTGGHSRVTRRAKWQNKS